MAKVEVLHLTPTQRGELHGYLRMRNLPLSVAQRMRIVLLLDEGVAYRDIQEKLGTPPSTISRWKQRYEKDGVSGLVTVHPGLAPQKLTPALRAKVLDRTRQAPFKHLIVWTADCLFRRAAQRNTVSSTTVTGPSLFTRL